MSLTEVRTKIALIIPVFNEVENIAKVIEEIKTLEASPTYSLEILVVDGGSRDGTVEAALQAGARVVQQAGGGYGAACHAGFAAGNEFEILCFLDGDYSDPPASLPGLLDRMLEEEATLALGSRTSGKAEPGALPLHAALGNRFVISLIALFCGHRYSDLPSLKAIRRPALASFDMHEMTYGWTTEMLVKAARSGCKIIEVPVNYRRRFGGSSKVSGNLGGSIKAAYYLVKTAFKYRCWEKR